MDAVTVTCATCRTKNQVPFVAADAPRCTQCQGFLPWITQAVDTDYTVIADSSTVVVCVDRGQQHGRRVRRALGRLGTAQPACRAAA